MYQKSTVRPCGCFFFDRFSATEATKCYTVRVKLALKAKKLLWRPMDTVPKTLPLKTSLVIFVFDSSMILIPSISCKTRRTISSVLSETDRILMHVYIYEFLYIHITGKSLSEVLLFAEHGENMLCTGIVLNVRNNFCTQHVLPTIPLEFSCIELVIQ